MDNVKESKYGKLKNDILSSLLSGTWKPGERIPSEHDIAAEHGVSRQTVRQALGELASEGWLYKVQGKGTFVTDRSAPATGSTFTIGLITTYISDYIFPFIIRGAESLLREHGYRLMIASTDNDKSKERQCLEQMLRSPVDGLIIEPTKSALGNDNLDLYLSLDVQGIPYVMINERYNDLDCPCFKVDDELGTALITEHLLSLGHQRFAGLFKTDDLQGVHRLKGFLGALKKRRRACPPDRILRYDTQEKLAAPFEAVKRWLKEENRPTALVCYNDELAVRLLEAIREEGLSVPEQLSIVGFDDSMLATASEVKLTTIKHPKEEMGHAAASFLLDMIRRRPDALHKVAPYPPELIIRRSTAEAPN